jgi:predicted helicase
MSEEIKNIYYSQKTIKKSFPKFFVRLKKNINDNNNNSEVQKYMIKSRNTKPIK